MKVEQLSENKVKITFDKVDMLKRNVDVKSFLYNSPESQDLFWDAMHEAEAKFGFSIEESVVCIDATVNTSGTFTLVVTKQPQDYKPNSSRFAPKNKVFYKLKRKEPKDVSLDSVYKFSTLNDLYNYCKIAKIKTKNNSSLYSYDNNYYIFTKELKDDYIYEFATRELKSQLFIAKLREYGKLIYKDDAFSRINKVIFK